MKMNVYTAYEVEDCPRCGGSGDWYEQKSDILIQHICSVCWGVGQIESRVRQWNCRCGESIESWSSEDIDCANCGQWFNSSGQEVNYPLYDSDIPPAGFDPSYCGESWDEDY
jgi:hypothetical protein